jgi:hypothetical protein
VRDPGVHAKARVSPHPHVHLLVRRCVPGNPGVPERFLTRPFLRSVRTRFLDRAGDDLGSAFGVFVKINRRHFSALLQEARRCSRLCHACNSPKPAWAERLKAPEFLHPLWVDQW